MTFISHYAKPSIFFLIHLRTDTEVYCIALGPYGKYDCYIHVFLRMSGQAVCDCGTLSGAQPGVELMGL